MSNRKCRARFKKFLILLDSGFNSTIILGILVGKLHPEKYSVMQWHTQAGNFTTNIKVEVDFTLPARIPKNVMTWKFHVDESAKGRYDIILEQDLLI